MKKKEKWVITHRKAILHFCRGQWSLYRKSPYRSTGADLADFLYFQCSCNIKRPPAHIRKLIKLIDFEAKMKGYE